MEEENYTKVLNDTIQLDLMYEQMAKQLTIKECIGAKFTEIESFWVNRMLITPPQILITKLYNTNINFI